MMPARNKSGSISYACLTKTVDHLLSAGSCLALIVSLLVVPAEAAFTTFESGQVRPLAISPDGQRLYAVNTPDDRLEIFDIKANGLVRVGSVPVGLEPVAVAARNNSEVWVVNHLSDSVSIVDVAATPPRVIRTLLVGDEPRDIVFAGSGGNRAFITTAHRGQNSPYTDPSNPGEMISPSIGRADVWVFDALNLGSSFGGTPLTIVKLFTDTPRALTVSPNGSIVYAAGFQTGNRTTAIHELGVCDGGVTVASCSPTPGSTAPGGLPAPNSNFQGDLQPEVGLIVKFDGTKWTDELNRNWNNMVRFSLPDKDVFAIDAMANPPVEVSSFSQVGTILYNMTVNPVSGKVYVANTDARNEVRFEGSRLFTNASTTQGRHHQARITIIDGASVIPRHLNKHIDYNIRPAQAGVKEKSLAQPMGIAVTGDGSTLYLAAFGSSKIGVFNTTQLENDSFVPSSANHIVLSGGGPSGLVLDETHGRLFVLTRFDNSIKDVNLATRTETRGYPLHNPEPASVVNGRRFLYDAFNTSSNGEAACGSCHAFGDFDSLAWDLGDPEGVDLSNPNPDGPLPLSGAPFKPMKGPMTTQSLRGLGANHGPMHWRGDRTAAHSGGDPLDEAGAFKEFNVAFEKLLGNTGPLTTAEMQAFTDFIMQVTFPPNPNRVLDNSLTSAQQAGRDFFLTAPSTVGFTCNACHLLNPVNGAFGSSGLMSFEAESQGFKIPHLRNLYQKVGMFGMPAVGFFNAGNNGNQGDQIRGFGFLHDGSTDTLLRFHNAFAFSFPGGDPQRRQVEQFMLSFDSNLAPIVGQQITLTSTNGATVGVRIDLMIARVAAGEADLMVKGTIGGKPRGWMRQADGTFKSDKAADSTLTDSQLRALAQTAGQELTYTAVPLGSGVRTGIDQDEDGVLDADDNCPATANPDQLDTDVDGVGDACDNCKLKANADQRDTNGDGYGNVCDPDLNNDGVINFADLALMKSVFFTNNPDADLNGDSVVNFADLAVLKAMFFGAPGPSALAP
jgi:YVTN family beta-propeller protein